MKKLCLHLDCVQPGGRHLLKAVLPVGVVHTAVVHASRDIVERAAILHECVSLIVHHERGNIEWLALTKRQPVNGSNSILTNVLIIILKHGDVHWLMQ